LIVLKKKKAKKDVREIPIDCLDPQAKSRWLKFIEVVTKIYKLQKNNSMFTEYQTSLSERLLQALRAGSAFYSNNTEFVKRLVNENSKREWIEATNPLLDQYFTSLDEFISITRDGTIRTAEVGTEMLGNVEKQISSIISRWGRLNDKGHGPEVEKMGTNLEALESSFHRIENVVVKFIGDQQQLLAEKQQAAEKVKAKQQQLQQQQQQQQLQLQQQQMNNQAITTSKTVQPEIDPNMSQIDREIYQLKNEYGANLDTDDPNAAILNALLDLSDL